MKTIRLEEPGRLVLIETEAPSAPQPGEALVRVHRIGVCGTDIHAFGGKQPFFSYPRILGHELGLEVLAVGEGVTNVKAGDRCAMEPYVNCGTCIACRRGRGNCCVNMRVIGVHTDGGMRGQFILPARKLHPSVSLSYEQLALVEPLSIGCHAVERAGVEPGEFVLVIGAGPIGLAVALFARASGARSVSSSEVSAVRRALAERCGAVAVDPGQQGVAEAHASLAGGRPDVIFECVGVPGVIQQAIEVAAYEATIMVVGVCFDKDHLYPNMAVKRELTLGFSNCYTHEDFAGVLDAMESGSLDPSAMHTGTVGLDELPAAFEVLIATKSGCKTLVDPSGGAL